MTDTPSPSAREKLSTTPSWIMVGFIVGVLFAFGVQRHWGGVEEEKPVVPPPVPAKVEPQKSVSALKERTSLMAIESVFLQYEGKAVWKNDLTEVALWNAETNKFSECFEVLRSGDCYYFRTLSHLTRPVVRPNLDPDLPLRFTEPEEVQMKRIKETSSIWLPPSTEP